ncbi:MAG TPA: hypothetical protein VM890_06245, partial [Longimicrobium sp.]|nr:hypothetical protein [Longimicrobium sp.]
GHQQRPVDRRVLRLDGSGGIHARGEHASLTRRIGDDRQRLVQRGNPPAGDVERLAGRKPRPLRDVLAGVFPGR